MVAAAIIGTGVLSAGASLYGSSQAASGAKDAADQQKMMYQITRSDLDPFRQTGINALAPAYNLATAGPTAGGRDYIDLAYQNIPGRMTQAELEATPGYQWNLAQGLKAVQGAAAARGLGVSGASLKGAGTYASGLADSTYKTQFDIRQKQFEDYLNLNTGQQGNLTNQFNRLSTIATLGANAAAQTGTQGTALANQSGKYLESAGLANAAGTRGVANALTGAANNYMAYNQYNQLMDKVGTGGYVDNGLMTTG
jgi:hypothetical protein